MQTNNFSDTSFSRQFFRDIFRLPLSITDRAELEKMVKDISGNISQKLEMSLKSDSPVLMDTFQKANVMELLGFQNQILELISLDDIASSN